MSVAHYLKRFLDYKSAQVEAKTFERYTEIVEKNLVPALGTLSLDKLRPLQIQHFYTEAVRQGRRAGKGGLSPRTVLHFHRVLRSALQQGVKWQLLARNPADAVEPPKVKRREMQTLDESQTAWLFSAAEGTRLYVPIVLESTTGIRRGEVFALKWQDVDLEGGRSAIIRRSLEQTRAGLKFKTPKTARGRPVKLPEFTAKVLLAHRAKREQERSLSGKDYADNDLVCPLPDGSPWPPNSFSAEFRRFRDGCGLRIRYHDLRHSHATQLMGLGVHPKVVSERLGHSSVGITLDLYSHVLPDTQDEAAERIDAALKGARERQQKRVH